MKIQMLLCILILNGYVPVYESTVTERLAKAGATLNTATKIKDNKRFIIR